MAPECIMTRPNDEKAVMVCTNKAAATKSKRFEYTPKGIRIKKNITTHIKKA
jgi:hypothetical protein